MDIRGKLLVMAVVMVSLVGHAGHNMFWQQAYLNYTPVKDADSKWSHFWLSLSSDYRYDEDHNYYFEHAFMGNYRFSPYFWMSSGYVFARNRPKHINPFKTENRYQIDMNVQSPAFWELKADMRFRLEWRDIEGTDTYNRYRLRPRIKTADKFTEFEIAPYISNEFFFSDKPGYSARDKFDHDRLQIGFDFKPFPESFSGLSGCLNYQLIYDISNGGCSHRPWNCYSLAFTYKF